MPSPGIEPLPVEPYLPEIASLLMEEGVLVLAAEPGAGKTSLAPGAVADALGRKVIVVEPRRVAAIAAAARIAELRGSRLGVEVGYRVRGDSLSGPGVVVEAVTPGVLVRMLQDDPELAGVGCVILDEFHERSAQADLALALLLQVRELSPGLRLLAMSATIDTRRTAAALGASVLEVPGRAFPVETRHAPLPEVSARGGRGLEAALARAALDLVRETGGDALVFLPGAAEIARAAAAFGELAGKGGPEAVALHGGLSLEAQRRVLSPSPNAPLRAVFATSLAETSLTVPRVRAVVDSGLARLSRFQGRTGLNRLVTEREAQDRADQRRGRAGRLGPGICLRAWSASEVLPERTEPEILRAELSSLALEAALWGAPGRLDLAWLDAPPEAAWKAAQDLLVQLGALTSGLAPTPAGRRMGALGAEPRLAALVLRGLESGALRTACLAAAILSERGSGSGREGAIEIAQRVEDLAAGRSRAEPPVLAEAARLERAALGGADGGARGAATKPAVGAKAAARTAALGPLVAAAFPDRIAERTDYRGTDASFRIPAGRSLRASGGIAQSRWIVALDADAGVAEGRIYSACAIDEASARRELEGRAIDVTEVEWRGLEARVTVSRRAGAIVLGSRPSPRPSREELADLLASRIASEGLGILPWEGGAAEALARARRFAAWKGDRGLASALSDPSLAERAAEWLGPYILAGGGPLLDGAALEKAVGSLVPSSLRRELDREAPRRIELPSGSSRAIVYSGSGGPSVEARVQEFFGLAAHPRVLGEPVVLRLLDPGGKPLQVTSDLMGFWRGSWAQARKELRGRYPKHEWPEDPSTAVPSRSGVKRRSSRR